ncbi:MAG: SRPBCC domain-containing protein, partial [Chloroflexota bacterium]
PSQLNRYIAYQASVEPEVNGAYDFGWDEGPVKILDLVPNEKLAYSWMWEEEPQTVATWTLKGSGGKTHLTLVHSGFGPDRSGEDYTVGWLHFLNRLKFMVEGGTSWQKPDFVESDY